jgi:hypothetical protein
MKSVTLSEVVRAHEPYRFLCPIQSWSQFVSLMLMLAVGLPLIAVLFMLLDPGAPPLMIVVPVLVGGLAPVFAALPARFDVATRFHARHFVQRLDETIASLGYVPREALPGQRRIYVRQEALLRWKENEIAVTLSDHAIAISGPVFTLRLLQQRLAG